jgi:hypothetical protein
MRFSQTHPRFFIFARAVSLTVHRNASRTCQNCLPELLDCSAGCQARLFDKQEAGLYNPPS